MEKQLLSVFPSSIVNLVIEYCRLKRTDFTSELVHITQYVKLKLEDTDMVDARRITSHVMDTQYWCASAGASHAFHYKRWPSSIVPRRFERAWDLDFDFECIPLQLND